MNILFTIHHTLSRSAGAPGVTVKLAEALRQRGHDVRIFSHDDVKGVTGMLRTMLFPWFVLGHVLMHPEYDVLDMSSGDGWLINFARRAFGWRPKQLSVTRSHGMEPVVHELFLERCRNGEEDRSWRYPLYHGGLRLWECTKSFAWADVAMLLNDTECEFAVTKLGFPGDHVVQIDNGIDETFASVARAALSAQSEPAHAQEHSVEPMPAAPTKLAFMGRANYWKGIETMTKAVPALFARNPQLTLTLFGTGEGAEATLARFPESIRERITAVPAFDNAQLPALLASHHILMFPSMYEGFPLSPLEAMACGLVPVGSNIGGLRAFLRHGDNGLIVPPGHAEALASAVQSLVDDPAYWARLQRRARETSLDYAWEKVAHRFERLYAARRQRRLDTVAV
ncbi:glycosyltransferase family 4 protein [Paraburkholderia kururiensis]|uniref:glycosyltransferase family 4 protein n=1 Tax=Paraburkholderia kururiensis TaxID=984307 RepID=UPI0018F78124|nr:glycosyltransferase family 4 protein [Paraburkholderia kururiensis]